ncbi:TIM44-related membrane protein TimA [Caulobacter sp. BE254]|uniref:TIM44-related membrane protein TimA n=1 Tax=Caulobacter sp. BE254 TaxID=2817720 RepID=UPI002860D98E|nr:TIM44-related membrane protein TimA [Caulobacter sp. BE254]MDR7115332.1 putative lipid-binding transport protein (Tim44 family) [Caulobacter sp. BE254]
MFEWIILAALAAVVLYQLYATLGRRVGRQPEDAPQPVPANAPARDLKTVEAPPEALSGIAALRARQADFDIGHFLSGARQAYEMIVKAFAASDRETLRPLLSPDVMANFETAIAAREAQNRTEKAEFLVPPRTDLDSVSVEGDVAKAVVRILAEIRTRSTSAEGEAVDDRRTADLWTFQRDLKSKNPNWTLVRVDVAEA